MGGTDRRMRNMKLIIKICNAKYGVALFLLCYVVVCQMVFNIDSYLYANTGHHDAAIFFQCGKFLMNGYTPYVDFADSKGLLLWIIYGLGYLIHHYSYIGVFWLACLSFWVSFMIAYKTARLYLDKPISLLAAMSMAVPYWYWNFYTEGKAEHFCMPFVAYCVYQLLKMIRQPQQIKGIAWKWALVGVSLVAVVMMKWSIGLMMMSLIISMGIYTYKQTTLTSYVVSFLAGLISAALPFLIYFLATDSMGTMWHEYFANTLASVSEPLHETIISYSHEWLRMITTKRIIYIVYTLPLLTLWSRKMWFVSALPWLSAMFFIALAIRHDNFGHYISIVGPFAIFAAIYVLKFMMKHRISLRYYVGAWVMAMIYIVWGQLYYCDNNFFTRADCSTKFEAINWQMAHTVEHPTLLIMGQDPGYCMGYSRPYCRYWITQMGQTQAMFDAQEKALAEGNADFVSLNGKENIDKYEPLLAKDGYHLMNTYNGFNIYTKHLTPPLPANFHVTPIDILKKHNMAGFE